MKCGHGGALHRVMGSLGVWVGFGVIFRAVFSPPPRVECGKKFAKKSILVPFAALFAHSALGGGTIGHFTS